MRGIGSRGRIDRSHVASSWLGSLLLASVLQAQSGPVTLEFSFSNPGARSLGLGGAFAAVADDATAAFANPAGLAQLTRPEVSIEGRSWRYTTPFTAGGRFSGEPTGLGLDTTPGLRLGESTTDLTGLSFLSFVYPHRNWSFALYRHLSANFETAVETQGVFFSTPQPMRPLPDVLRSAAVRATFDLELESTGVAVAYRFGDTLSLGLAVSRLEGRLASRDDDFVHTGPSSPGGPFARNSFAPEARFSTSLLEIDESVVRLSLGVLWHVAPRWDVGAFFRDGPRFEMQVTNVVGPALVLLPEGTTFASSTPIDFPEVYGAGVAYRSPSRRATWSFEWDRVGYSAILDSLTTRDTPELTLDDADELHLGFEYVFPREKTVVALRAGVWLDPDHRIRGTGIDPVDDATRLPGDDEIHYAVGFGLTFETIQLDFGADFSDPVDTVSLSAIYSF